MLSSTRRRPSSLFLLASGTLWLPSASAFSFNFENKPTQCANLSLSITGSDGAPPYRALVLPFGGSPLPGGVEARKIIDQSFGSATSVSFQLKYPTNSQFVVVVSDSSTFGNGGTSAAAIVESSSDASCFNATTSVSPQFAFNIEPNNQVIQCSPSRLWWDPTNVQGNPTFYGVIPGGESFNITQGQLTTVPEQGIGFNWTANIPAGTTLMLGSGDNRGLGAGGSVTYIVAAGINPDNSCLNNNAPSSTPGSPAGGSYPTSTSEASNSGGSGKSSINVGAIVGGVIGGLVAIVALILLLLFFRRRKRFHARQRKERPDLFTDGEGPASPTDVNGIAPPDPFIVPPPSTSERERVSSEWGGTSASGIPNSQYGYGVGATGGAVLRPSFGDRERRLSAVSGSTGEGTSTGERFSMSQATSSGPPSAWGGASRKSGAPPAMRPVNIIQHEDAGAPPEVPPPGEEEPETVELPPAYTNLRKEVP